MIRVMLAAVVLLGLAACAPTEDRPTLRELDRIGRDATDGTLNETRDTCQMAAHANLVGQAQSAIDSASLPAGARFICFGCMATQDRVPRRLNLQLGPDHKVASLRCG